MLGAGIVGGGFALFFSYGCLVFLDLIICELHVSISGEAKFGHYVLHV